MKEKNPIYENSDLKYFSCVLVISRVKVVGWGDDIAVSEIKPKFFLSDCVP